MTLVLSYIGFLTQHVKERISNDISIENIESIVKADLYFHIENKRSAQFQDYYYIILCNKKLFIEKEHFFRAFKKEYALQGIDNDYLDSLESNKERIIALIEAKAFVDLYFEYFKRAMIKHKTGEVAKELGSFFSKLVHTFKPDEYCALDNPVKVYFGLRSESFFLAFCVISRAYREWTKENENLIVRIRQRLKSVDRQNRLQQDRMTDLKLLDLIFWRKADRKKKEVRAR